MLNLVFNISYIWIVVNIYLVIFVMFIFLFIFFILFSFIDLIDEVAVILDVNRIIVFKVEIVLFIENFHLIFICGFGMILFDKNI